MLLCVNGAALRGGGTVRAQSAGAGVRPPAHLHRLSGTSPPSAGLAMVRAPQSVRHWIRKLSDRKLRAIALDLRGRPLDILVVEGCLYQLGVFPDFIAGLRRFVPSRGRGDPHLNEPP